jgi:hypothetical protein
MEVVLVKCVSMSFLMLSFRGLHEVFQELD